MSAWRAAGISYIKYATECAAILRASLKEPHKTKMMEKGALSMKLGQYEGGAIKTKLEWVNPGKGAAPPQ